MASSELTITISSIEEPVTGRKYQRLNRKRFKVKSVAPPTEQSADDGSTLSRGQGAASGQVTMSRSGRVIRAPDRYEPQETVVDDYAESEYGSDSESEA